tara:strand:+ start:464 stop:574 length:111 start_codon:yes stop_codon:yes gene_type:complete
MSALRKHSASTGRIHKECPQRFGAAMVEGSSFNVLD